MKTDIAYIYILRDPIDNEIRYVGKTINPKRRLAEHIAECKRYNHHRAKWIKKLILNRQKPILEIVKICPLSEFEKYETHYIKLYKSRKLTNSDSTGQGSSGRRKSIIKKSIKKISRNVYQFDLVGNFMGEYISVRDASRRLHINHTLIVRCCNKEYKHTSGFIFSYTNEINIVTNPNAVKKKIIEVDMNNNIIGEWCSLMDCSRSTSIDSGNLSKVCSGKLPKIKGRIFKFKSLLC